MVNIEIAVFQLESADAASDLAIAFGEQPRLVGIPDFRKEEIRDMLGVAVLRRAASPIAGS
ncbi:MAG: hypothetical protein R3D34_12945 [Nitratireductor sp.]